MINDLIIGKDMEGRGRGLIRYYPSICLGELKKTTKNFSQDSQSPGRYLIQRPPEYEAGVPTTLPTIKQIGYRPKKAEYLIPGYRDILQQFVMIQLC
jgi:hypothetical protein